MLQVNSTELGRVLRRHQALSSGNGAVAVLILLLLVACDSGPKETSAPAPGVLVAKAAMRQISETIEYIGQTVAVNDVSLRAQVDGYLLERKFDEGQDVEQGTELFLIDPALYQAGVAAAEGAVAEASAAVARSEKDVKRYRTLVKNQSVSQQQLDNAESEFLQASASLKTAEAQLLKAQIDLSHTTIVAPINGRIGRAAASAGDLVTPQTGELARLVELDPIYASFSVSEGDVIAAKRRYQAGNREIEMNKVEVRLRLPDGSEYEHVGRVDFIDNVVDRKTGTIVLRARFDNPQKLLVPGLYVSTMLGREETTDKLIIPQSAVQEDQAGKFVMVVAPDNKVELRRIQAGQAYAGELVVNSGLEPGEQVVVEGIQKVRPGQVVDAKLAPRPSMQQGGGPGAGNGSETGER
ncbi:efflux RND transporter periplasmic adaptor subunit [Pseudomonadota bacterium]